MLNNNKIILKDKIEENSYFLPKREYLFKLKTEKLLSNFGEDHGFEEEKEINNFYFFDNQNEFDDTEYRNLVGEILENRIYSGSSSSLETKNYLGEKVSFFDKDTEKITFKPVSLKIGSLVESFKKFENLLNNNNKKRIFSKDDFLATESLPLTHKKISFSFPTDSSETVENSVDLLGFISDYKNLSEISLPEDLKTKSVFVNRKNIHDHLFDITDKNYFYNFIFAVKGTKIDLEEEAENKLIIKKENLKPALRIEISEIESSSFNLEANIILAGIRIPMRAIKTFSSSSFQNYSVFYPEYILNQKDILNCIDEIEFKLEGLTLKEGKKVLDCFKVYSSGDATFETTDNPLATIEPYGEFLFNLNNSILIKN